MIAALVIILKLSPVMHALTDCLCGLGAIGFSIYAFVLLRRNQALSANQYSAEDHVPVKELEEEIDRRHYRIEEGATNSTVGNAYRAGYQLALEHIDKFLRERSDAPTNTKQHEK